MVSPRVSFRSYLTGCSWYDQTLTSSFVSVTHNHWYVSGCTITTGQIFVVKFEDKILWMTNDCENHKIVSLKTFYSYGTCLWDYHCCELELVDTVQMYILRLKLLSISRWCFLYSLQALVVEVVLKCL